MDSQIFPANIFGSGAASGCPASAGNIVRLRLRAGSAVMGQSVVSYDTPMTHDTWTVL